ncbi:YidC/Oxa1 family membrane protein insertase [Patescibacteria group bacterium]|nr:YidC/Oxa1 family membrane protein insertase [Patescibacteria group bacterium]
MKKNFIIWVVIAAVVLYLFSAKNASEDVMSSENLALVTTETEVRQGKGVVLKIQNNTPGDFKFLSECPNEPFKVFRYVDGEWLPMTATSDTLECSDVKEIVLKSGENMNIDYSPWKMALFSEIGRYQLKVEAIDSDANKKEYTSNEFSIVKPSFIVNMWREGLYRPFYNLLIALSLYLPFKSLGLAIIILTIIIRSILLVPSQKAMKAQRRMQDIQPKLTHIKEKYKGDQQRIAQETMKIWRENKVNPLGTCLPILVQFPIMIALFYVVREGLDPNNIHFLYEPLKGADITTINSFFLGFLELTKPNAYVLPFVVGGLQFAQMKLAMAKKKGDKPKEKKKGGEPDMAAINSSMMYIMPAMLAVFTATLPAGVGLYWGVSTLFGIVQQVFVNKGAAPANSSKNNTSENNDDVKVRLLN